jgi:hypothetical protein
VFEGDLAEVYVFEGDLLDLEPAAATSPPHDTASGVHEHGEGIQNLSPFRVASRARCQTQKKEQNKGTQRMFWLTNHTPGCNWDTYKQLEYRRNHDAGAFLCNPCFAPLKTWEEQVNLVKAAIISASQE